MTDLIVRAGRARFGPRIIPCVLGKGGARVAKREGDGATPIGAHRVLYGLYRADRLRQPRSVLLFKPIGPRDLWSDDLRDPAYNCRVTSPHGFSHEYLRRSDPLYDLVLVTDWNMSPPQPGRGSAIFLHTWRRPGWATEGCVAFSRRDLMWIVEKWTAHSRVVVQP
jgi:L,D-peptidoglycan transpeptidase YkuD (ErfK/YbiS/YcfS/YnhG family)